MSYRAGIGPAAAALLGVPAGGPRITCDGCGRVRNIPQDRPAPNWFLAGRPVPGWTIERDDADAPRRDYCRACRKPPASSGASTSGDK